MKEICSCCGIGYQLFNSALFNPHLKIKGYLVPVCVSCAASAFETSFRIVFGMKVGTEYT
jgi:hypothetical protein